MATRREHDLLGERELPVSARFGIHTQRAVENFPLLGRPCHPELLKAFGAVKLAAVRANVGLGHLAPEVAVALEGACAELMAGGGLYARLHGQPGAPAAPATAGTAHSY